MDDSLEPTPAVASPRDVQIHAKPIASPAPPSVSSPGAAASSAGVFPSKQQQNDEATAPLDDQERRAVQRRMQRREDERKAAKAARLAAAQNANGSMSVREGAGRGGYGSGSYTPKGSWLSGRLTGRRTARGASSGFGGMSSVRSAAQTTARSMMSTSRSMMTTARSDVNTGRYNDTTDPEATETRILEHREDGGGGDEERRRRPSAAGARSGKTPRKTAASTAAGLLRRSVQMRKGNTTGRTPRTARMGGDTRLHFNNQRQVGERPAHG